MAYGEPEILIERFPLEDPSEMIDEELRAVCSAWQKMFTECGNVPVWNVDFGLHVPSVMSRAAVLDTSGDDVYFTLIGEVIREFMSLKKSRGPLGDLIPEANANDIRYRLNKCAELRAPHYCLKTMSWNENRDYVKYEVLYLPFVKDGADTPTWFFVAIAFHLDGVDNASPIGTLGPPEQGSN